MDPRRLTMLRAAAIAAAVVFTTAGTAVAQQAASPAAADGERLLEEMRNGTAKDDYRLGSSFFASQDYANALAKYRQGYQRTSNPFFLYNMAICEWRMHRYKRVLELLQQFQREVDGVVLPTQLSSQASELEREAKRRVSYLIITVSEEGANVVIDDEPIGTTPLKGKVMVESGTRRVRVVKQGFKEHVRVQPVAPGAEAALTIRLERRVFAGKLSVVAAPGDRIALNGKLLGHGRWDGTVPSGRHVLQVTAPGKEPYRSEIVVEDGKVSPVHVHLNDAAGVSPWIWIAGGAALVGAVVGGILLLQPSPDAPIQGTLGPTLSTSLGARW